MSSRKYTRPVGKVVLGRTESVSCGRDTLSDYKATNHDIVTLYWIGFHCHCIENEH